MASQLTIPELLENIDVNIDKVWANISVECGGQGWYILPANTVVSGSYGTPIDREYVARKKGYEQSMRGVPALHYKCVGPGVNNMLYGKGSVQSIGAESAMRGLLGMHLCALDLTKMGIPAIPTNLRVSNTTVSVKPYETDNAKKFKIDLQRFANRPEYRRVTKCKLDRIRQVVFNYYDPVISHKTIRVVIYSNGKFNIMGGLSEHRLAVGQSMIRIITHEFIRQTIENGGTIDPKNVLGDPEKSRKRNRDDDDDEEPKKKSKKKKTKRQKLLDPSPETSESAKS